MALSSEASSVTYSVTAGVSAFSVPFRFLAESDLVVTTISDESESALTLDSDYSVSGAGESSGGEIAVSASLKVGSSIVIRRVVPLTQTREFPLGGRFPSAEVEGGFDHAIMAMQQILAEIGRSMRYPSADGIASTTDLPTRSARADRLLAFDSSGNPIASSVGVAALEAVLAAHVASGDVLARFGPVMSDGTLTRVETGIPLGSPTRVMVVVGGVTQASGAYGVDGTVVTLSEPVPAGVVVHGLILGVTGSTVHDDDLLPASEDRLGGVLEGGGFNVDDQGVVTGIDMGDL